MLTVGIVYITKRSQLTLAVAIFIQLFGIAPWVRAAVPEIIGIIKADTENVLFGEYPIIPAGDQNGDGCADFWGYDVRHRESLFNGSRDSLSSTPVLWIDSVDNHGNNIGDVSGDGYDDFAWSHYYPEGLKLNIYFGGPDIDTIRDRYFGENTGVYLQTYEPLGFTNQADYDADGKKDLICRARDQHYTLLYELDLPDTSHSMVFRPFGLTFDPPFGEGMATGDFNGDSFPDLGLSMNPPEILLVPGEVWLYFGGPSFDTIPDIRFAAPSIVAQTRE